MSQVPLVELDLGYSIFANDFRTCSISLQSSESDKYAFFLKKFWSAYQEAASRGGQCLLSIVLCILCIMHQ